MKIIYKYPIQYDKEINHIYILVPKYAQILSVGKFNFKENSGFIYALVDKERKPTEKRKILWFGTGVGFPEQEEKELYKYRFLGTIRDENPNYVWHIWVEEITDITSLLPDVFDLNIFKQEEKKN